LLAGAVPAMAQSGPLAEKLQLCTACHGEDGNSKMEKIPSLAGQPAFFILNQLFLMRERVRKVEAMAAVVKDLKDQDLTDLSEHFAKLAPKKSDEPVDPELAKRGGCWFASGGVQLHLGVIAQGNQFLNQRLCCLFGFCFNCYDQIICACRFRNSLNYPGVS